jgi:HlyD family secretion protein
MGRQAMVLRLAERNTDAEPAQETLRSGAMDRHIRPPRITRRRSIALLLAITMLAALTLVYVRYARSNTLSVSRDRLTISTAARGTFTEYIPLTGNVVPRLTVYLDAVDGGQVTEVFIEEGAQVKAHQPLVKLKNTRQELEVMRLEAELTQQLNQLSTAKLSFAQATLQHDRESIDTRAQIQQLEKRQERRLLLNNSGAVSRAEIEDGAIELSRYRQLLAALQKSQAVDIELQSKQVARIEQAVTTQTSNLKLARDSLASLTIVAPFDGQVTTLNANVGEAKNAGQRIGQIDQLASSKVMALVDEFYLTRVSAGQIAAADIDGKAYKLTLSKIYPEVRDRQFKVDFQFADAAPAVTRFGQTLQLRLDIGGSNSALLIANGPFYENASQGLFVVAADQDYAERRKVKLGRRNPDNVEVLAGLSADEYVITSSYEDFSGVERLRLR